MTPIGPGVLVYILNAVSEGVVPSLFPMPTAQRAPGAPASADALPMAAITMDDFLNGCSQFRTTLSHASHKVVREWDPEALKNAFGWADYIEQVSRAPRREPPASPLTRLAVRRR